MNATTSAAFGRYAEYHHPSGAASTIVRVSFRSEAALKNAYTPTSLS